jgi:uncharacterized membrane protein
MLLVSGYLSYIKLSDTPMACVEGVFNCSAVQGSVYSEVFGVPIAVWGFLTNLLVLFLLLMEDRHPFFESNGLMLLFGVVFFEFIYSIYLVSIQAAVLEAYCPWCLTHEALVAVLFVLTSVRLKQYFDEAFDAA